MSPTTKGIVFEKLKLDLDILNRFIETAKNFGDIRAADDLMHSSSCYENYKNVSLAAATLEHPMDWCMC